MGLVSLVSLDPFSTIGLLKWSFSFRFAVPRRDCRNNGVAILACIEIQAISQWMKEHSAEKHSLVLR